MESILLASSSPRRRELLSSVGIGFEALPADVDESLRDELPPAERVIALARDKAEAAARRAAASAPRLVLGADTLVCLPLEGSRAGEELAQGPELALGKPEDRSDAARMMRLLAGRRHFVRTGLALLDRGSGRVITSRSDSMVGFAPMSEADIELYLSSGEWRGVAGAYRIQGFASFFITELQGSWSGVVGLPMRELYVILNEAGYRIPAFVAL
jgi:septum formation protein